MRRVIKRNGEEVEFNKRKIACAISAANNDVSKKEYKLRRRDITEIVDTVVEKIFY